MDVNDESADLGDDQSVTDWVADLVDDYFDDEPVPPAALDDPDLDGPDERPLDEAAPTVPDTPATEDGDGDAGASGPEARPAEIVLDLDADDGADPSDPAADEGDHSSGPGPLPWPAANDGVAGLDAVERAADLLVGASLDQVVEVVERLGVADELDLGLDSRTTAVLLGELGVEALVEHGSLDDLTARLAAGDEVLVTTAEGRPATLVQLVAGDGEAELISADGQRRRISLDLLEERWAAAGYEMVVAEGAPSSAAGRPIRLTGAVTVLPIVLPEERR